MDSFPVIDGISYKRCHQIATASRLVCPYVEVLWSRML